MSVDHGKCHCGQTQREIKLGERVHILWLRIAEAPIILTKTSHYDTCKMLSGGTHTLDQIIPKEDIKLTKGKLNAYT
jgi:hypothetical protein